MGKQDKTLKVIGKGLHVKDAVEKVTGTIRYGVDYEVQNMAHGCIVRCPHAHARITNIDSSKAEALPGFIGILTHEDVPQNDWESAWFNYRGKVLDGIGRFVGDDMAAVAATTPEIARKAAELIEIEYELLPAVFNMEKARLPDAPQIRDEGNERDPYGVSWGNVPAGEAASDHTVECDIFYESQQYAPLGRNACIAEWTGDCVNVITSSQTPSELRDGIHEALGFPLSKIRVQALPSGSSFGQWWSNNFMMISVLLAKKIRKAVKIELTNEECMATVKRRHQERTRGSMGCNKDGELTFFKFDHLIDNGGYGFKDDVGFFCVDMWGKNGHGDYQIHGINTNMVTAGCMRGVGDCTLGASVERCADQLAEQVGIDPVDFRIKNQIVAGDELRMQHSRHNLKGEVDDYIKSVPEHLRKDWPELFKLSAGGTRALLETGSEAFNWKSRWKGWATPTHSEGSVRRGIGVGTGAHVCGVEFEGASNAMVRLNPDGSAKVHAAVGRQGAGAETTQAMVVAEELGLTLDQVEIETGDTDSCPWNHGSLASSTMYRTGWASREAARDVKNQLLAIAAHEFFDSVDPSELDVEDGEVVHGDPGKHNQRIPFSDVLNELRSDSLGQTSSITGSPRVPMPPSTTFARQFGAQFAEVEVDIETGQIKLLDFICVQDSGTVVNPQVLKNQVIGAAICGTGFAIYEHMIFDENTGALKNGNLLDYKLLRCADFPHTTKVIFVEDPDPVGPFGARGAGESPIAAGISAVAQAVYNATGVWVDMPMTPERVVTAIKAAHA
ncbi:xanthine dehydrogenase family protein molybdopterin-binding subunit [Rhodobacteraceae bacterium nBUS_24]